MLLTTLYRENAADGYRAEIYETYAGYTIQVFNPAGTQVNSITVPNGTAQLARSLAEQALQRIQTLNG